MLDFIKEKLAERMPNNVNSHIDDPLPNETFMECAHLIQELSDLSVEGKDELEAINGTEQRPLAAALEIPLEDDLEIGSVELNVLNGRITDVAADTAVPTVNEYALNTALKTEADFYQEACEVIKPLFRDSEAAMEARRQEYVTKKMAEYTEYCIQEGLFGHDKVKATDPQIMWNITCNFGPLKGEGSADYYVKLPVAYECDKKRRILKKQLETVAIVNQYQVFTKLKNVIHDVFKNDTAYKCESVDEVWDHATPVELLIPASPADKYVAQVGIEVDWSGDIAYFTWSCSTKGATKTAVEKVEITKTGKVTRSDFTSKKELIKESADILAMEHESNRPSRFKQTEEDYSFFAEAVDMGSNGGDTDMPPSSGTATDDVSVGGDAVETPSTDNNSSGQAEVQVKTNDVSDQIADKVAADNQDVNSQNAVNDDLNNLDDMSMSDDSTPDFGDGSSSLDTGLDTSVDAGTDSVDAGDTSGMDDTTSTDDTSSENVDLPGDDASSMDMSQFENMSIEDLMAQGSEKLKGMTIAQLKDFLSGNPTDPIVEEAFQEAFFLTPRNINKELDKELKRVLGILNESDETSKEILAKFKKHSKKLNRALVKAAKINGVYNDDEKAVFAKLNKCLVDLNMTIGTAEDANYAAIIKRLIQAFVSQATAAAKVIEEYLPKKPTTQTSSMNQVKGMSTMSKIFKKE